MQITKLSAQVIAGAMLCLILTTLGSQAKQPRPPREPSFSSLRRAVCVGSGPGRWSDATQEVAIARAVFRSLMHLNPSNGSATVTCRIRKDEDSKLRFRTLDLALGMLDSDTNSPPAIVNVYLDGRQAGTQRVAPGEAATFSFPVSDVRNVAIEATCSSTTAYCSRVYIIKAALERIRDRD